MMKSRLKSRLKTKLKPTRFLPTNAQVNEFNLKCLEELGGSAKTYTATVSGQTDALKLQIIRDCIAPEELILKEDAQVMILKNDRDCARFINGSMGVVTRFTSEGLPVVRVDRTGEEIIFINTSGREKMFAKMFWQNLSKFL